MASRNGDAVRKIESLGMVRYVAAVCIAILSLTYSLSAHAQTVPIDQQERTKTLVDARTSVRWIRSPHGSRRGRQSDKAVAASAVPSLRRPAATYPNELDPARP